MWMLTHHFVLLYTSGSNLTYISQRWTCSEKIFRNRPERAETLLKRDSNTGVFMWILQNFYEQLFYRIPLVAVFVDVTLFTVIATIYMMFFVDFLHSW